MSEEKKKYRDWFDKLKETDIAAAPEEEVEAGIDMTHYRYSFSLIIENNEAISRVIIKKLQQLMRNDSRIPDWAFSEQRVTEMSRKIQNRFCCLCLLWQKSSVIVSACPKIQIGISN